jgi:adenine phosphoribosyltransferase
MPRQPASWKIRQQSANNLQRLADENRPPMPVPKIDAEAIKIHIRDVPDFPKPGIVFKDITPLLANAAAFNAAIELLAAQIAPHAPQGLLAIESRGFIFGAALAQQMKLPLLLLRKPGKLPWHTERISYDLEYGSDALEIHQDAISAGSRYAIVDDVLATGGTAAAAVALIEKLGGHVAVCAFLMELSFLNGRARLPAKIVESLIEY